MTNVNNIQHICVHLCGQKMETVNNMMIHLCIILDIAHKSYTNIVQDFCFGSDSILNNFKKIEDC